MTTLTSVATKHDVAGLRTELKILKRDLIVTMGMIAVALFTALSIVVAQAEDSLKNYVTNPNKYEDRSECIREMHEIWENMARAKRLCDPNNYVSNPNEYGWLRPAPECPAKRIKGSGWKLLKDAPCE